MNSSAFSPITETQRTLKIKFELLPYSID
uniref:Uncharacterized protein n=1 Tax=Anguilla anguilla TaxID=7936 RepID=A0A0E9RAD9_ANGAN